MTDIFDDSVEEKVNTPKQEVPQFKYNIVNLPSKGKFGYSESVEYRDILVRDEKVISSATPENFQKTLNNVLKDLLKDSSFFEKLTIDDRDFLLTWIWANNYPTKRKIEYTCPHCTTKNNVEFDIVDLEIIELEDDYEVPEYELRNGTTIKIRPLTVLDEENITKFCKTNPSYEDWFVGQCLSIDFGKVMPVKQKINYIENEVSGYDMSKIRGIHIKQKYGVPNKMNHICSACGEDNQIDIPFQVDFFLPVLQ